jgi:hypothetical protein
MPVLMLRPTRDGDPQVCDVRLPELVLLAGVSGACPSGRLPMHRAQIGVVRIRYALDGCRS